MTHVTFRCSNPAHKKTMGEVAAWIYAHFGDAYWEMHEPDQSTGNRFLIGMFDGSESGRCGYGETLSAAFEDFKKVKP